MKRLEKIEKILNQLDLTLDYGEVIHQLLSNLGFIGVMKVTFGEGKPLIRARPMLPSESRFKTKDDFSFKPQRFNKTFQRASTPNRTMFYASTVRENLPPWEFDKTRIIGLAESMPWIRDKSLSGLRKIAYGKWLVHEPIYLIAIVNKTGYHNVNSFSREIYSHFLEKSSKFSEGSKNGIIRFHDFLANQFSKEVDIHLEYQISAFFSEIICNDLQTDGIMYPSFRMDGNGLNVAIKPNSMYKLGLYAAGECNVFKVKDQIVVGNSASVLLDGRTETFEMVEENNDAERYLKMLGINTIEELKAMDCSK